MTIAAPAIIVDDTEAPESSSTMGAASVSQPAKKASTSILGGTSTAKKKETFEREHDFVIDVPIHTPTSTIIATYLNQSHE